MYSFKVLEDKGAKSICWKGRALSEVSREESFIPLFWILVSPSNLWMTFRKLYHLQEQSHIWAQRSKPCPSGTTLLTHFPCLP